MRHLCCPGNLKGRVWTIRDESKRSVARRTKQQGRGRACFGSSTNKRGGTQGFQHITHTGRGIGIRGLGLRTQEEEKSAGRAGRRLKGRTQKEKEGTID